MKAVSADEVMYTVGMIEGKSVLKRAENKVAALRHKLGWKNIEDPSQAGLDHLE